MSRNRYALVETLESRTLLSVAEPNNTFGSAVELSLLKAGQNYSDTVSSTDSVDYFHFQVAASNTEFHARLRNIGGDGHAYVLLFQDKNGNGQFDDASERIATSGLEAGTTTENMTMFGLETGNAYYVGVFHGSGTSADYALRLQVDSVGENYATARDLGDGRFAQSFLEQVGADTTNGYNDPRDVYKVNLAHDGHGGGNEILYVQITPADGATWLGAGPTLRYVTDDNGNGIVDDTGFDSAINTDNFKYLSVGIGNVGDAYLVVEPGTTPFQNYTIDVAVNRAGSDASDALELGSLNGRVAFSDSLWSKSGQWTEQDFYRFEMPAPGQVTFNLNGNADPNMSWSLLDVGGATIASGLSNFVQFQHLDAGSYSVRVDRPANPNVDNYALTLVPDFAGNGPLTGLNLGTLSNMKRVNDFIDSVGVATGDILDYYKFTIGGTKPAPLYVDLTSPADANLSLFKDLDDGVGTLDLIAESKNRYQLDSIATRLAPGKYQIVVTSGAGSGNYTLSLWPGDIDDTTREADRRSVNRRAIGQSINGTIEAADDVDLFSFTARAGQRVGFDLDVRAKRPFDSYIRLFDAMGGALAGGSNNDGAAPGEAASRFSYLRYTFPYDGLFYVGVSSSPNKSYEVRNGTHDVAGRSLGAYVLTLSNIITGTATIGGNVFYDRNGNGRQDSGEAGLAGRTLFLDLDNDGAIDEDEILAITDSRGNFTFDRVPGGAYQVRLVPSSKWTQTTPANKQPFSVALAEGITFNSVRFGVSKRSQPA